MATLRPGAGKLGGRVRVASSCSLRALRTGLQGFISSSPADTLIIVYRYFLPWFHHVSALKHPKP